MFLTYLRREVRRRARQAIVIALGLAVGVGLVITVTAASAGVGNAQAAVLHSLYGVGTDVTVTRAPAAGTGGFGGFSFGSASGPPAAGTRINSNRVSTGEYAPISAASVARIAGLRHVAGAEGALLLNDSKISFTAPRASGGSKVGTFRPPVFFSVAGVDLSTGALGPLSSAKLASGRTLRASDRTADVAVVDSNYAKQNKLKVGSTVTVGNSKGKGTAFTVVGVVSSPSGTGSDVYIPLARAQALAGMQDKVNTIYVAASSAADITNVRNEIAALMPKATVTTASSLAKQVTGSLASASRLASTLGRWLAIAVLAAAFALACLLTMSAVSRRVREFGTLKALGWKSRRVIGQVMGESIVIGVAGGVLGVALGFAGAALVGKFAPPLTATVGQTTGSATPGGARQFGGGGGGGFGGTGNPFRGAFQSAARAADTVAVHLSAPVTIGVIVAAVGLAVLGGLIAGSFGGWRAARLRPAAALSKVA